MIRDENLKKSTDYAKGMVDAAYRVLGEIVNLLAPYEEDMRIVGGWVPYLLYQEQDHIGSIDVDVLLNQQKIRRATSYENIKRILLRNGYKEHSEKSFSFIKTVEVQGIPYDVDVDFLAGKYGGDSGSRSKHVDGIKALPADGGNFAFEFPPETITIDYTRPDGAKDSGHVNVVAVIPYLVMKTAALGRGKPKDAYDIYYCITHYEGGVRELAKELILYKDKKLIQDTCKKLSEKFASPEHVGPVDIARFLELIDEEEIERVKQDAYQKINYIVELMYK